MTKFEVFDKQVKIGNEEYRFRPLEANYLPKIYRIVGKMPTSQKEEDTADFLQNLNEQDYKDIIEMGVITLQRSYTETDIKQIEGFVCQNLLPVFMGLMEVNVNAAVPDKA
jgi:hypothetical protein